MQNEETNDNTIERSKKRQQSKFSKKSKPSNFKNRTSSFEFENGKMSPINLDMSGDNIRDDFFGKSKSGSPDKDNVLTLKINDVTMTKKNLDKTPERYNEKRNNTLEFDGLSDLSGIGAKNGEGNMVLHSSERGNEPNFTSYDRDIFGDFEMKNGGFEPRNEDNYNFEYEDRMINESEEHDIFEAEIPDELEGKQSLISGDSMHIKNSVLHLSRNLRLQNEKLRQGEFFAIDENPELIKKPRESPVFPKLDFVALGSSMSSSKKKIDSVDSFKIDEDNFKIGFDLEKRSRKSSYQMGGGEKDSWDKDSKIDSLSRDYQKQGLNGLGSDSSFKKVGSNRTSQRSIGNKSLKKSVDNIISGTGSQNSNASHKLLNNSGYYFNYKNHINFSNLIDNNSKILTTTKKLTSEDSDGVANCVLVWNDKTIYEGGVYKNQLHGKGKLKHSSEYILEGDFLHGKFEGDGTYRYKDLVYKGKWKGSVPSGQGEEILEGKYTYKGNFENGMKNGNGYLVIKDKGEYEGNFKDNFFCGYGYFKWYDGREYRGVWSENMMHGRGKMVWPDGRKYEGKYSRNLKDGFGVFEYADGRVYMGYWKNGKQNGKAVFFDLAGNENVTIWDNGKRIS